MIEEIGFHKRVRLEKKSFSRSYLRYPWKKLSLAIEGGAIGNGGEGRA